MRVLRRKKKRRSNRQPRAAARGRPPPWCPAAMAGGQGKEHAPATGARQHTARQSKTVRPTAERSDRRGVWGHAATTLHASPRQSLQARACALSPARAVPATDVHQGRRPAGHRVTPLVAATPRWPSAWHAERQPQRSAGGPAGRPTRQRSTPCRLQGDVVPATDPVLAAPGCLKLSDWCWV